MIQLNDFSPYQPLDIMEVEGTSSSSICRNDDLAQNVTIIPFNQYSDLIFNLDYSKHSKLYEFYYRFGGLCELVCNRLLIDGLLGHGNDEKSIKKNVTVERMNEEEIKKSHLLDVYSVFSRAMAFSLGIYPDNIFSYMKQWKLVDTKTVNNKIVRLVNREILSQGLKNIREDETLKFEVFCKNDWSFAGHSLLIKKMENNQYIFFDPNTGEHRGLSIVQLIDKIDEQLEINKGTDIFLLRGKDYLKRLGK